MEEGRKGKEEEGRGRERKEGEPGHFGALVMSPEKKKRNSR